MRLTIQAALEHGAPVIPGLIDGAEMPSRQHLPSELHELVQHPPLKMSPVIFFWDQLIDRIKQTLAKRPDIGQDAGYGA